MQGKDRLYAYKRLIASVSAAVLALTAIPDAAVALEEDGSAYNNFSLPPVHYLPESPYAARRRDALEAIVTARGDGMSEDETERDDSRPVPRSPVLPPHRLKLAQTPLPILPANPPPARIVAVAPPVPAAPAIVPVMVAAPVTIAAKVAPAPFYADQFLRSARFGNGGAFYERHVAASQPVAVVKLPARLVAAPVPAAPVIDAARKTPTPAVIIAAPAENQEMQASAMPIAPLPEAKKAPIADAPVTVAERPSVAVIAREADVAPHAVLAAAPSETQSVHPALQASLPMPALPQTPPVMVAEKMPAPVLAPTVSSPVEAVPVEVAKETASGPVRLPWLQKTTAQAAVPAANISEIRAVAANETPASPTLLMVAQAVPPVQAVNMQKAAIPRDHVEPEGNRVDLALAEVKAEGAAQLQAENASTSPAWTQGAPPAIVPAVPLSSSTPRDMAPTLEQPGLSEASRRIVEGLPAAPSASIGKARPPISLTRVHKNALDTESADTEHDANGIHIEIKRPRINANEALEKAYDALMAGNQEEAIALYREVLDANPANKLALFGLATTYHRAGQIALARPYYGRLLALDPNNVEGLNNFLVLLADESPKEALVELGRLEISHPSFSPVPAQMADIYAKVGDYENAAREMRRAMDLSPENLKYRYNMAIILDKAGDWDDAALFYQELMTAAERGEKLPAKPQEIQERLTFIRSNSPKRTS